MIEYHSFGSFFIIIKCNENYYCKFKEIYFPGAFQVLNRTPEEAFNLFAKEGS